MHPTLKHDLVMQKMLSALDVFTQMKEDHHGPFEILDDPDANPFDNPDYGYYEFCMEMLDQLSDPGDRELWDATSLPFEFLCHTGEEYFNELQDHDCMFSQDATWFCDHYFEFAHGGLFITEVDFVTGGKLFDDESNLTYSGNTQSTAVYEFHFIPFKDDASAFDNLNIVHQLIPSYVDAATCGGERPAHERERFDNKQPLLSPIFNDSHPSGIDDDSFVATQKQTVYATLGVICLLEERLTSSRRVEFPERDRINERRKRKGKRPIFRSDYHTLQLNINEVRRRTAQTARRKHESPRLHWRRGHWRTLHRYSIEERKTWVRKCLVGDPDKGMLEKHYRVVNQQNFR